MIKKIIGIIFLVLILIVILWVVNAYFETKEIVDNQQDEELILTSSEMSQEEINSRYKSLIDMMAEYEVFIYECEKLPPDPDIFNAFVGELNALDQKFNLENFMIQKFKLEPTHKLYDDFEKTIKKSKYIQDTIDECLDKQAARIWE